MSATIWSKFYWSDWLSDAGLRRCSFSARGLWIDMLCIAAQSDPIGYLAVNNETLSVHDIARMVGGSEPEVSTLLEELARNGVLSRDRTGKIYSRRMVRDAKKSRIAQKNGKLGGNPKLGKDNEISASDNPPDKGPLKTHIPSASSQSSERKKEGGADAPSPDFGETVVQFPQPYVWQGAVIRLKREHYDQWRRSYHDIPDFNAALQKADDYYAENPPKDGKWFFAVSKFLEREHAAAVAARRRRIPDI